MCASNAVPFARAGLRYTLRAEALSYCDQGCPCKHNHSSGDWECILLIKRHDVEVAQLKEQTVQVLVKEMKIVACIVAREANQEVVFLRDIFWPPTNMFWEKKLLISLQYCISI